jgi:zinc protease
MMTNRPVRRAAYWPATALVCAMAAIIPARAESPALSNASTDRALPTDGRLQTGQLPNGLKWIFRSHNNPPGKLFLMLHVRTGSLNETDEQRGLAHFIEHMCFNGTANFPPGTLVPYFESIGMEFGADLNASTGFESTRYTLSLPNTQPAEVDKALLVMSDYAFRAEMRDDEIDKERGIILSEKRARDNVAARLQEAEWQKLYPQSHFAQRLPIGIESVLTTAKRDRFLDFYRKWYRPDLMTLIIVGDTTLENVKPSIEKHFGAQPAAAGPAPTQTDPGITPAGDEQRALVLTDRDYRYCVVELKSMLPEREPTTTMSGYRRELVETILRQVMNRRYSERQRRGEATYQTAAAAIQGFVGRSAMAVATASCRPDDWEKALTELVEELTRARAHGFTQRELDLVRRELLAEAERDVRTEPTVNANSIVRRISFAIDAEEPVLSAEQHLEVTRELLPQITPDELARAFNENFVPSRWTVVLKVDPSAGQTPTEDALLATLRAAMERATTPPSESDSAEPLIAKAPTPAEIVERTTHDGFGITTVRLSNGVRVHHRFMDYKKDQVLVSINLAGGQLLEQGDTLGITEAAALALEKPATKRLSSQELSDRLVGHNIAVSGGAQADKLSLRVRGSPEGLELGLQVAHALLTEGRIEETAFDVWKAQRLQQANLLKSFVDFQAGKLLSKVLTGDDPRFDLLEVERTERQELAKAQAWFEKVCAESPIEVAVVGEIEADRAFELIAKCIGSLPSRPANAESLAPLRVVKHAAGPIREHTVVETGARQANVRFGFFSAPAAADDEHLALQLAEKVLSTRVIRSLREEKAWVYSIAANSGRRRDLSEASAFSSGSTCAPENVDNVAAELQRLFTEFAEHGPTDEELSNAKKQVINNRDTQMKEPMFWWNAIENLETYRVNLAQLENVADKVNAVTREQVQTTFARYYTPERMFTVIATAPVEELATSKDAHAPSATPQ